MTLRERIEPFRDRQIELDRQIYQVIDWLKANPDPHPDVRKEKFALWEALEQEQFRLQERIGEEMDAWTDRAKTRS